MKSKNVLFVMFMCVVIFLNGCAFESKDSNEQFNAIENIVLYDYDSMSVGSDFLALSNDDVEMIIQMDLSSQQQYVEITNRHNVQEDDILLLEMFFDNDKATAYVDYYIIGSEDFTIQFDKGLIGKKVGDTLTSKTEEIGVPITATIKGIFRETEMSDENIILKFYSKQNMGEVKTFIIQRAQQEIIFNFAWEEILNNSSLISFPQNIVDEIEFFINEVKVEVEKSNKSADDYATENYGCTIEELRKIQMDYYYEYLVAKAIATKENISITEADIQEKIIELADSQNCSEAEITNEYSEIFLEYEVLKNKIRPIIINSVRIK